MEEKNRDAVLGRVPTRAINQSEAAVAGSERAIAISVVSGLSGPVICSSSIRAQSAEPNLANGSALWSEKCRFKRSQPEDALNTT